MEIAKAHADLDLDIMPADQLENIHRTWVKEKEKIASQIDQLEEAIRSGRHSFEYPTKKINEIRLRIYLLENAVIFKKKHVSCF